MPVPFTAPGFRVQAHLVVLAPQQIELWWPAKPPVLLIRGWGSAGPGDALPRCAMDVLMLPSGGTGIFLGVYLQGVVGKKSKNYLGWKRQTLRASSPTYDLTPLYLL